MSNIYFQKTYQRSFGTYPLVDDIAIKAILTAIEVGYRSIDTAQMYANEVAVGQALSKSGISRDDLCITTKVHPDNFDPQRFIPSVQQSLKDLQLDYVDVLLLHWPPVGGEIEASLHLLAESQRQGLAKHIGVSNYTAKMMKQAVKLLDIPIVCNQVEFHPLLNQDILLEASEQTEIPLTSYCSVARGKLFDYSLFEEIGKMYEKTASQIALHWILQKGVGINTMSTKKQNMENNFNVMDFILTSGDMSRIDNLMATNYRIVTSDLVPWAPDWD